MSKIDDILNNILTSGQNRSEGYRDLRLPKDKESLKQAVLECVGEYDSDKGNMITLIISPLQNWLIGRNHLRNEIRERINKLFEEEV